MKNNKNMSWGLALKYATSWRAISWLIDFSIAYLLTGETKISLGIASGVGVIKYITNIMWLKYRIKIGK